MNPSLFNYLLASVLSDDKNMEIPKSYNPKVNLQTLAEKVKNSFPDFDEELLYSMFPERKEITASKLFSLFDEENMLDIKFNENLDAAFDEQFLSETKLRELMKSMNFPELTKKEMGILMDGFDMNKDGMVSRADFMAVVQEVIRNKI